MIYRVHMYDGSTGSEGYEYFASKKDADGLVNKLCESGYRRDDLTIESANTPASKSSILALLQRWGSHPDNG